MTRKEVLAKMLEPITWPWTTSLNYRKNLVTDRRNKVSTVYPFLTKAEKAKADEWLKAERHDGLWD